MYRVTLEPGSGRTVLVDAIASLFLSLSQAQFSSLPWASWPATRMTRIFAGVMRRKEAGLQVPISGALGPWCDILSAQIIPRSPPNPLSFWFSATLSYVMEVTNPSLKGQDRPVRTSPGIKGPCGRTTGDGTLKNPGAKRAQRVAPVGKR